MAKYSKSLQDEIAGLIEQSDLSIQDICTFLRLGRKTFYRWKEENEEFRDTVCQARELRDDRLAFYSRQALREKLEGRYVTEERYNYVAHPSNPDEQVFKSKVVRTRYIGPDLATIKYILRTEERRKEKAEKLLEAVNGSACMFTSREPEEQEAMRQSDSRDMTENVEEAAGDEISEAGETAQTPEASAEREVGQTGEPQKEQAGNSRTPQNGQARNSARKREKSERKKMKRKRQRRKVA
jgi:hypothetical protein